MNHTSERGNAVIFILITIALLAALAIVVTRSSDDTTNAGDRERGRVEASELMRFTKGVEQTVKTMSMRGVSENDLSFDVSYLSGYTNAGCTVDDCKVFNVAGGGLSFDDNSAAQSWSIFGDHAVQDVGSASSDLIMQAKVGKSLCMEINRILSIPNAASDAPADDISATSAFTGSFTAAGGDSIIGNDSADFAGKSAGCRKDGTDYYFYHVLIAR